jgi:large subunit ribosomal protein L5
MAKAKLQRPRLQEHYESKVVKELMDKFGYKNPMRAPRLSKIVVSMGVKEGVTDSKAIPAACDELMLITGQKPIVTKAKKSIAGFKLRQGMAIGCKVTLRGRMMYEFLDRVINIALPRVKDFRGLRGKQFDGAGNFALGLKEQIVFPEINYDKIDKVRGMNIVIVTSAESDKEAKALLECFDMPFMN